MTKRILVVDDEPDFTYSIKTGLETLGDYEVMEENSATNAVVSARAFRPQLILLDIMMPDLDGSEVAAAIRADPQLHGIPILFLTALVSQQEAQQNGSWISGGNTFLPKPLEVEKLMECIEEAVAQAGETDQAASAQPE